IIPDGLDLNHKESNGVNADILPRTATYTPDRRLDSSRALQSPDIAIVVTPSLLESLSELPLARAAASLGLNISSFKRACRRLGIPRWRYTRGPSKTPPISGRILPEHSADVILQ
ncbi:MAG: RWP-RK domain-containing protein, partial [bacterium]